MNSLRVVCISDTHNRHDEIYMPTGDILIHAGDMTNRGTYFEVLNFAKWLGNQPYLYRIVISGNHDWLFEKNRESAQSLIEGIGKGIYLQDSSVCIDGITFYGSPFQPTFCDWAFNLPRGEPLSKKWEKISDITDVIITHTPPHGIGDDVDGVSVGCEELSKRLAVVKPKYSICGHIHQGYGVRKLDSITCINASICNKFYDPVNQPIVFDIEKGSNFVK